jgi:hypothetical protein
MPLTFLKIAIAGLLLSGAMAWRAQGQDAQEVTQSVLDQHKSADPTNSDRSLTNKNRTSEARISDVPFATARPAGPPRETVERAQQLQAKRAAFIRSEAKKKKAQQPSGFVALRSEADTEKASVKWDNTPEGKTLRRLEKEIRESSRESAKTEPRISGVPFAKPKR